MMWRFHNCLSSVCNEIASLWRNSGKVSHLLCAFKELFYSISKYSLRHCEAMHTRVQVIIQVNTLKTMKSWKQISLMYIKTRMLNKVFYLHRIECFTYIRNFIKNIVTDVTNKWVLSTLGKVAEQGFAQPSSEKFPFQKIETNTKPDILHRMIDLWTLSIKGQVS